MTAKEKESRRQKIVAIFNALAEPAEVVEVTRRCIEDNLWAKDYRDKAFFKAAQKDVRDALNSEDLNGLPVSLVRMVEIEEDDNGDVREARVRVQKTFWTEDDAVIWVKHRVSQLRDDFEKIKRFVDGYCAPRWPDVNWWNLVPIKWTDGSDERGSTA